MHELLTPAAMAQADSLTIANGLRGSVLMERAGRVVADAALAAKPQSVLVLCGPGNNGGDGYVAARLLAGRGIAVCVATSNAVKALSGDAALAAQAWDQPVLGFDDVDFTSFDLVIDALFGAGLARPITDDYAQVIDRLNQSGRPVLAVDVPSGVDGLSGQVLGVSVRADYCVTFFRAKPAHYLYPGRALCGSLTIADIGIEDAVLSQIQTPYYRNHPDLWVHYWPDHPVTAHKYHRSHVLVCSGGVEQGGAARLAARAALRGGAGLVTIASPSDALTSHAAALEAIMVRRCDDVQDWCDLLADHRRHVLVIGPGLGLHPKETETIRQMIAEGVRAKRALVLDAGALTAYEGAADLLKLALARNGLTDNPCVITPHEGEFARLFSQQSTILDKPSKAERALAAAHYLNCVVLLKGADTVIASPDGLMRINDNAPAWLGTAGSGDVLAGLVAAFLAQSVPARDAAAMAVYVHGLAGQRGGRYLIADDLEALLQPCLQELAGLKAQISS